MLTYAAAPKKMLVVAVWTILAHKPTYSIVVTCLVALCGVQERIYLEAKLVLCVCVYSL